ncbi:hypothetical protein QO179_24270 [Bacillus stercoris]|nr:hypothetical protein [Bacillus stercoris]
MKFFDGYGSSLYYSFLGAFSIYVLELFGVINHLTLFWGVFSILFSMIVTAYVCFKLDNYLMKKRISKIINKAIKKAIKKKKENKK